MQHNSQQSGFALLITMVVVGVIVSIGLTILDLTLKQVRLSTNARESEVAFQAANAGMECARYWRRQASSTMERGLPFSPTPTCFATSPVSAPVITQIPTTGSGARVVGNGDVFRYEYEFTWGAVPDVRCTQITTIVASTSPTGVGATTTRMTTLVPGFRGVTNETYCAPGSRCTVAAVRGYNQPCNTIGGYGVVQREVLLQF